MLTSHPKTGRACNLHNLLNQTARDAATPRRRLHQHADAPDVPLPTAELLVQRGDTENFVSIRREQRQVATEINALAPFADDADVRDAMLDEHALLFGDGLEQRVKLFLVGTLERAQLHLRAVFESDVYREFSEFKFE